MSAVLVFSAILLIITLINYTKMQKKVTEGSTCGEEIKEVETNWKGFWISLIISIIGVVVGIIGCLFGYY